MASELEHRQAGLFESHIATLLATRGLATTREETLRRSAETPALVTGLCRRSKNPIRRIFGLLYLRLAFGSPSYGVIPAYARDAAPRIGFRPMAWMLSGTFPPMLTANFIGPDGFVKLEVFGFSRVYLSTNFDDGTAISTAPGVGGNVRTTYLAGTSDLHADYLAHLREVTRQMAERGCAPLYRSTPEAHRACWKLFPAYHVPAFGALVLLLPWVLLVWFVVMSYRE